MAKLTMKTEQALALSKEDFESLSDKQQRQVARQVIDIAHKRFLRGVDSWGEFGALRVYAEKTATRANKTGKTVEPMKPGTQSIVGKTGTELYREFQIAQEFLNLKTSTAKGRMDAKKKFEKTIGNKLTISEFRQVFEMYDKTKELHQAGVIEIDAQLYGSDNLFREMSDFVKDGGTVDEWLQESEERINDLYERNVEEQNDYDEYIELLTKKGKTKNDYQRIQELQKRYGFSDNVII